MKRILLSVSIIFVSVLNMHAITKDEAYALFSSQVNENTMNVYSALITSSYLPEQVSTTGFHWAFFVDEEPQKGWDGTVNQATIDVCCSQGFKSLVSLPSTNQLSLELHSPASDGTKIQITPTMATGLVEEYRVKEGESEMTIQTSRYPKGLCIVSLKVNGRVVESRQVVLE